MRKAEAQNPSLKYLGIMLAVVFLIAAALLFLEVWEKERGRFPDSGTEDGIVVYRGQTYKYKDTIETFLVLGLDKQDGADPAAAQADGVQTDFLMLFVFDNETEQCAAIHINRDTVTKVKRLSLGGTSVVGTYTEQIALAYNYANSENHKIRCRNTKDSVEFLLDGAKVDHYLSVTMDFVVAGCDLVGGVEVTVLDDFTGIDDALVKGKTVTLTGEQALRYVRTRYGLEDSTNLRRMERQRQYINAWYAKAVSRIKEDSAFALELVDTLGDYVVYDSSEHRLQKFAEKFDRYEFLGIREPEGRTEVGEEFLEFYPDEESLRQLVIDLFYEPAGA
ncbi:MAG: LCP family protein [Clostridia bacterium]|nr:LCP family protein [Clostridia bacterium]